jgi:hypothetical protein
MEKKRKIKSFVILSVLILLFVNITLISGYILIAKYGSFHLNPGEKYIINIPFITFEGNPENLSNFQLVCGTALDDDKEAVEGVYVKITYAENLTILGTNITDENGKYCIILPGITSKQEYEVSLEYDNETFSDSLVLGSNDYELNFEGDQDYIKNTDQYFFLRGKISNEDAVIENGLIEIKLAQKIDGTWKYSFGDYRKYYVNISSRENYNLFDEINNISWEIPANASIGEYKFLVRTSFNAMEKGQSRGISTPSFYLIE